MDELDVRSAEAEERVLKRSIFVTLLVATTGVLFGAFAGANPIVFVFSVVHRERRPLTGNRTLFRD